MAESNRWKLSFSNEELEHLNHVAKSSGLNSGYLLILCSWLESKEIVEKYKLKLIECLIPEPNNRIISEEICIRLACLLKASQTSVVIKVELLKWMISAYAFMETSGRFEILYEMFLGLLKYKELLPYTAHFLLLITQKKHVTFRRVQCLYRFVKKHGYSSHLMRILDKFSYYAPEFFYEDYYWNEDYLSQFEPLGAYPSLIKNVHITYNCPDFFNIHISAIENNSTAALSDCEIFNGKNTESPSFTFTTFYQFYKHFKSLERSTNISKVLKSKFSRIFLTLNINPSSQIKIQDYCLAMLHDALDSHDIQRHLELFRLQLKPHPNGNPIHVFDTVDCVRDQWWLGAEAAEMQPPRNIRRRYKRYRSSFPGMSELVEFLLLKVDCYPDFTEVLRFQPICCYKKIQYKMEIIRGKFWDTKDIEIKCQWLSCLSKMYCFWILQSGKIIPCNGECNEDNSDRSSNCELKHVASTEISRLGSDIDFLCDFLIVEDSSPYSLKYILEHYEMSAVALQLKENFIACFPSPSVFQLSLFSLTSFVLEALCRFLLRIVAIFNSTTNTLKDEEFTIFRAACNDIKKIFHGSSYKSESTYLAKTKIFKELIKRSPEFQNAFVLTKHPALLLITIEINEEIDLKNILIDPECKQHLFNHLTRNGYKDFIGLISRIK